jgi:hypothetical protein
MFLVLRPEQERQFPAKPLDILSRENARFKRPLSQTANCATVKTVSILSSSQTILRLPLQLRRLLPYLLRHHPVQYRLQWG